MNSDNSFLALEYNHLLKAISHYQVYEKMLPWVGKGYPLQKHKVLLVAESHYVGPKFDFHLDPEKWYSGVDTLQSKGYWTRDIIIEGVEKNWRKKSATIYRNLDNALCSCKLLSPTPPNAFTEVAFMNYFQRPAEVSGKSIKVCDQDAKVANEVFQAVTKALNPDVVIFCSSLAYRYARESGAIAFLRGLNIHYVHTPHPGMPWWNRKAKKYGGKNGKQLLFDFIDKYLAKKSQDVC